MPADTKMLAEVKAFLERQRLEDQQRQAQRELELLEQRAQQEREAAQREMDRLGWGGQRPGGTARRERDELTRHRQAGSQQACRCEALPRGSARA